MDFQVDLIELVGSSGVEGLTAKEAASAITGKDKPSAADVEKARRRLNQKVQDDLLVRIDGNRGGGSGASKGSTPTAWFLASSSHTRFKHGELQSCRSGHTRGSRRGNQTRFNHVIHEFP